MRKIVGAFLILVICLLAVVAAQAVWLHFQWEAAGYDGDMIDVDGRRLHLVCTGPETGEATYVLEAGVASFAAVWQRVQKGLAVDARVCAYDRAGLGASDPAADEFTPERVRRDLKAALDTAGEKGPFVLVGHSLGGVFARAFAAAWPDSVAALVLVDPTHEDQHDHFDEAANGYFEKFRRMMRFMPLAARLGVLHIRNPVAGTVLALDGKARERALLYRQSPGNLAAASAELAAWDAIMDDIRRSPPPPSIPTLVVSAGAVPGRSATMKETVFGLHRRLAGRATAGRHVVIDGADHFSLLTDPEIAARLVRIIQDFTAQLGR
jgi:pimeloyl-ACP methyl ester carboxylesterase